MATLYSMLSGPPSRIANFAQVVVGRGSIVRPGCPLKASAGTQDNRIFFFFPDHCSLDYSCLPPLINLLLTYREMLLTCIDECWLNQQRYFSAYSHSVHKYNKSEIMFFSLGAHYIIYYYLSNIWSILNVIFITNKFLSLP